MKPARFEAFEVVTKDRKLSFAARTLYTWLHILGRNEGIIAATQDDLAETLGMSRKHLNKCVGELVDGRHVFVERGQRDAVYRLAWAPATDAKLPLRKTVSDVTNYHVANDPDVTSDVTPGLHLNGPIRDKVLKSKRTIERYTLCHCGKLHQGTEPRGCSGHLHDPMQYVEVESVAYTRDLIWGYVQHWNIAFPAPPDDFLCQQVVDSVDGDLTLLYARLRAINDKREMRPSRTYGWFPKVIGGNILIRRVS